MATAPDPIPLRYSRGAALLHWLMAALVLLQIYVGWTFHHMERGPARGEWFLWHKTIGVTILLLALVRLGWRLMHRPPPFPPELPRWQRLAATWNHRAFYFLIIILPLTGLTAISDGAESATTSLQFGLAFPLIPGVPEALGDLMGDAHEWLVKLTIALLALHVAAALKHQLFDRNRMTGRMPPLPPAR
jgi:cytochrome b561